MPPEIHPPNAWYLRKNTGDVYGPVDLVALREWAGDGRIAPDDSISTDGEDWRPAYELDSLGMVWVLDLADGQIYGPAHRGAFEDMIKNGELEPPLHLRHRLTGAERILGGVTPAEPAAHRGDTQPIAEAPADVEPHVAPAVEPVASAEIETLTLDRDRFAREAAHWRALYETESGALRDTAARLSDAVQQAETRRADAMAELEALRAELTEARSTATDAQADADTRLAEVSAAQAEIERAREELGLVRTELDSAKAETVNARTVCEGVRTELASARAELAEARAGLEACRTELETCRAELEALRATPPAEKADDGGAPEDVAQVCRDLMVNYDRLVAQFAEKTVELRQAREEAEAIRTESEARVKVSEDYAARERHSAEAARRRLEELESSYTDIVKSYRDINDRFILMRERQTSVRPAAPAGSHADHPSSGSPAKPESKPRIRLRH